MYVYVITEFIMTWTGDERFISSNEFIQQDLICFFSCVLIKVKPS